MEIISIKGDENDPWRPETIHTIRGFFSLLYKHTICGSVYSPFHSYFSLFFPSNFSFFPYFSSSLYLPSNRYITLPVQAIFHLLSSLCFYIYVIFLLIINHFFLLIHFFVILKGAISYYIMVQTC